MKKKGVKAKFKPHYSGSKSNKFWEFINNHKKHSEYYLLGVILQDLEYKILSELNVPINRRSKL